MNRSKRLKLAKLARNQINLDDSFFQTVDVGARRRQRGRRREPPGVGRKHYVMDGEIMRSGTIKLHSGKWFRPLARKYPGEILIEDIAHSLAHVCRFNGHTRTFYSVADHSIRVAEALPDKLKLWGLLHDAAEAYLGDVVGPIKDRFFIKLNHPHGEQYLPGGRRMSHVETFSNAEDRVLRRVALAFGLGWPIPERVKTADLVLLLTELRDLMDVENPAELEGFGDLEPQIQTITPRSIEESRADFLATFARLHAGGKG